MDSLDIREMHSSFFITFNTVDSQSLTLTSSYLTFVVTASQMKKKCNSYAEYWQSLLSATFSSRWLFLMSGVLEMCHYTNYNSILTMVASLIYLFTVITMTYLLTMFHFYPKNEISIKFSQKYGTVVLWQCNWTWGFN